MQIAVLDASDVTTKDLVFAVAAADKQIREHVAPAYDVEPWPVVFYRDVREIPADAICVLVVVDKVPDGEWGDHDALRTARVLWKGNPNWIRTFTHEIPEMFLDVSCNLWLPHPGRPGYKLAREVCDPCQDSWYSIDVEVMGETRKQAVSDFVLPAYWVEGAMGPYNYLDTMKAPGEILPGGYQIVRTPEGVVDDLWYGQRGTPGARGALIRVKAIG